MKTKSILKFMYAIAWFVFIGLCIKTFSLIVSYFLSIYNPEKASNLFYEYDLSEYYLHSFYQYSLLISYKIIIFGLEAYIAFLIIMLLEKLDIKKPFTIYVATAMKKVSYAIFYLWLVILVHNTHMRFLAKKYDFTTSLFSSDFLFLAGVIFVFAQILKRGIEMQQENDLTI